MNTNYKKIIVSLLSLVVLFLIFNFYFKSVSDSELNVINDNITSKDETLETYSNVEYNFSIQYPSSLVYKEEKSKQPAESDISTIQPDFTVSFNDKESDFSSIRLNIFENTKFTSLDDWLKADNQLSSSENNNPLSETKRVLEKNIQVGGVDAFVTFVHNINESDEISKHERKTVFIKDGDLFVISTRFIEDSDHEEIWKSFNFSN